MEHYFKIKDYYSKLLNLVKSCIDVWYEKEKKTHEKVIDNVISGFYSVIGKEKIEENDQKFYLFEIIIQLVLIKTLIDIQGNITQYQIKIMQDIAEYGDVIRLVNLLNNDIELDWDDFCNSDKEDLNTIYSYIKLETQEYYSYMLKVFLDDDEMEYAYTIDMYLFLISTKLLELENGTIDNIDGIVEVSRIWTSVDELELYDEYILYIHENLRRNFIERYYLTTIKYPEIRFDRMNSIGNKIRLSDKNCVYYLNDNNNVFSPVIYIESYIDKRPLASGSGVIISDDGYALTCRHFVEHCDELLVKIIDDDGEYDICRVESVFSSADVDMAIIKIDKEDCDFYAVDFERKLPSVGEAICIMGYPFGDGICDDVLDLRTTITKGYIASIQNYGGYPALFLDADARHGNSGGPVISLQNGKVIGLLNGSKMGQKDDRDEMNFSRPVMCLKDYFYKE